jgi:hypothetical protein
MQGVVSGTRGPSESLDHCSRSLHSGHVGRQTFDTLSKTQAKVSSKKATLIYFKYLFLIILFVIEHRILN